VITKDINKFIWQNELEASIWQIISCLFLDVVTFTTFFLWILNGKSFSGVIAAGIFFFSRAFL